MTHARIDWRWLVGGLLAVILFIPIRRYEMPFELPIQLEPYRIAVLMLALAWLASLLVDSSVRMRRSGLEAPLLAFLAVVVLGLVANRGLAAELQTTVIKAVSYILSFLLVFYLIVSVARTRAAIETIVTALVLGGAIVSFLAVIESRTGFNAFDRIQSVFPLVRFTGEDTLARGQNFRASGSAEHPIALGALLVMVLPLALYAAFSRRRPIWWVSVVLLAVGATATVSRTAVAMLLALSVVYLIARPRQALRLSPLVVPFIVAVHFATPGTLGTLRASFGDEDKSDEGRTSDYATAFEQVELAPFLGSGTGTRIVTGVEANAEILDNQWLASLIETGIFGVAALIWLYGRYIWRLLRAARGDPSPQAWLVIGLAAGVAAWVVGMFLFDSFSFVQATFVLYIYLALGAVLVLVEEPLYAPRLALSTEDVPQPLRRSEVVPGLRVV